MANNAITRPWADVEHCRAAIKELEQELKELDHELEEWKDSNLGYLEDKRLKSLFEDKTNGVDQANKRLAKANECLDFSEKYSVHT